MGATSDTHDRMREWVLAFKNLLFPQFCRMCRTRLLTEENGYFCPACWEDSPRIRRPFCSLCGKPHPGLAGFGMPNNYPCAPCRERPNRRLRMLRGAARYEGAVAEAVRLFKFEDKIRLARPLGELLAEYAAEELAPGDYDLVVPVPLHKVRERDRGYNQSRLLAQALLPVFPEARLDERLKRIRPTRAQSSLKGAAERKANVRGAFAVVGPDMKGARALLVDDVVTTAETVTECGAALGRAGAARVDALAVALSTPRVDW